MIQNRVVRQTETQTDTTENNITGAAQLEIKSPVINKSFVTHNWHRVRFLLNMR